MPKRLWLLLLAALIFRFFLSPFGTHQLDFNTYLAWSNRLANQGFFNFYQVWCDYLPGYLYILGLLGKIKLILPFLPVATLYKLPSILTDIFSGLLIYRLLINSKKTFKLFTKTYPISEVAAALYLFNPISWANSALWGQTDSLVVLFSLLWFSLLRSNKPLFSGIALGIGGLIKPSLGLIAPLTLVLAPRKKISSTLIVAATSILIFILGFAPFASGEPLAKFILARLSVSLNQYPYTSLHSFNLWQIIDGYWRSDQSLILGLSKQVWGQLLFVSSSLIACLIYLRQKRKSLFSRIWLIAMVYLSSFLLLTRIHERHLLTALPFLTMATVIKPKLKFIYFWLSTSYLMGLLYSHLAVNSLYQTIIFTRPLMIVFSLLNLLSLLVLLLPRLSLPSFSLPQSSHLPKLSSRVTKTLLLTILLFTLLTRVIRLATPPKMYFDEVYHVVTAQAHAQNNSDGYEWWHEAPQPGTAYDWLHPPLAKLIQALSINLLGNTPFSWRFPGVIFGVLSVFLVYRLALTLFPHQSALSLLAPLLFALDGLNLVQSRITMNDIFLTAFVIAAVTSFIKFKQGHKTSLLFASLFTGLAISTKWTGIYLLPIFGAIELTSFRLSNIPRYFLAFLVIPSIIYLLSYSQFFLQGHTWGQFSELHNQIWHYQTGLTATHTYQSSAWSWPLNLRPVWYYVNYGKTTIANIYALGNPLILWSGLLSVMFAFYQIITSRSSRKPLLLLLICYLLLFLPWAFSPRIMFFYHYLPATPFMAILLAWVLSRFPKKFIGSFIALSFLLFVFFYPHWTAIPIPTSWDSLYFWLPSWK